MRGKKQDVCHDCRQHKIGCDGIRPACSQCRLTGRLCRGYLQDLVVFHHKPTRRPHHRKKTAFGHTSLGYCNDRSQPKSNTSSGARDLVASYPQQPTWDECVAVLVQHYIPKDEIPFLLHVEPSKSRICGGWVQALPHVSQDHEDFQHIVSPAVRALTMSMSVTGTGQRQDYLDTYGTALQGIRAVLDRPTDSVAPTVAIAGMCLALSEVLVPTSSDGYNTHLRGVAAMMQSRSPTDFQDDVAHLMFVGVRPLLVLDAILRREKTFLMYNEWQTIPFSVHPSSRMQVLLGHATGIPPLLEAIVDKQSNLEILQTDFLEVLIKLQDWEDNFMNEGVFYRPISPNDLDLPTSPHRLPNPCFGFADVSHANSLTHCWAFRIVCLLQLSILDNLLTGNKSMASSSQHKYYAEIKSLCNMICQGIPYLLQREMRLYGSMSAGFPLHMVLECLHTVQLHDCGFGGWYSAIKEQMQPQRIALYEEMAWMKTFT